MYKKVLSTGDRVVFTSRPLHEAGPMYYPAPGTVGIYQGGGWVQWPEGTTSADDLWHAPDSALKTAGENGIRTIVITYDGSIATAVLTACGRTVRTAQVRCAPISSDDGEDINSDAPARRALDKLLTDTEVCPERTGNKFKPYLVMHGDRVGVIGTPTRFRDILDRPLTVGDVVEIFNRSGVSYGDNVVCDDSSNGGAQYIMGIKSTCNQSTGSTGYWKLLKKRGYGEVRHDERIDGVVYVLEDSGTC